MLTSTFFCTALKELRKSRNMSQQSLGDVLGVSANTVRAWEQGIKKPSMDALMALGDAFHISLDALVGRDAASGTEDVRVWKLAERYRELDRFGKTAVDEICRVEWERVRNQQQAKIVSLERPSRMLPVYDMPSAAGVNVPMDNDQYEMTEVGEDVPARARFGVRIQGESMMPYIGDGEIVYVDPSATLRKGDVGIFAVDGAVYCKIYYVDNDRNLTLVSANPELQEANIYIDQSSGQEVHTFGKVLGHSEVRIPDTFPG